MLGDVTVSYRGEVLGTAKLVANTSVSLSKGQYIKSELNQMTGSTVFKVILLLVLLMFILYIVFVIRYNRIRKERHRRAVEMAREEAMYRRQAAETTTQKSFEEIEEMLSNEENAAKK